MDAAFKSDRLRMAARLLYSVIQHPDYALYHQFSAAALSFVDGKELSELLESKQFLRRHSTGCGERFNLRITSEGLIILKQINLCYDALVDKTKLVKVIAVA
jgi:hypothetical protein